MDDTNGSTYTREQALRRLWLVHRAHLVACGNDKRPFSKNWQNRRDRLQKVLDAPHAGMVVCSPSGKGPRCAVGDVDVKDVEEASKSAIGVERRGAVVAWAGETPCMEATPSGGWHLWYAADAERGKVHAVVPGVPGKVEVFGRTGQVILYDPAAVVSAIEGGLPVFGGDLSSGAAQKGAGGERKARDEEGRRNDKLNLRVYGAWARGRRPEAEERMAWERYMASYVPCAGESEAQYRLKGERTVASARQAGQKARETTEAVDGGRSRAPSDFVLPEVVPAPFMPEPRPLSVVPGLKASRRKTPHTSEMLAEQYVAEGRTKGRFLRVLDDNRWLTWVEGHGWMDDTGSAMLLGDMQRFGSDKYFTPQGEKKELRRDAVRGGQQRLAREATDLLPRYKGVAVKARDMSRNPNLLGLPGGRCHDLSTGKQRTLRPDDLVMKYTSVKPQPVEGSIFEAVIAHMLPDDEMRVSFQRLMGSMLWAQPMGRHIMVVPGKTGAGKTTLLKLVSMALGPYATQMKSDTLTTRGTSQGWQIDNANAMLRGVRVAVMSELPTNRKLDPGRINELTGGDTLLSRRIGGNLVETQATHSIVFAMNDVPDIDTESSPAAVEALFQRLRVFHMARPLGPELGRKGQQAMRSTKELGAVLQWMLDGAAEFRKAGEGPIPPQMARFLEDWWHALGSRDDLNGI